MLFLCVYCLIFLEFSDNIHSNTSMTATWTEENEWITPLDSRRLHVFLLYATQRSSRWVEIAQTAAGR